VEEEVKAVIYPLHGIDAYELKYSKVNLLGSGAYSNVFRATRKYDNKIIAIKRSI
jgi:serine/threonine protein kinase